MARLAWLPWADNIGDVCRNALWTAIEGKRSSELRLHFSLALCHLCRSPRLLFGRPNAHLLGMKSNIER